MIQTHHEILQLTISQASGGTMGRNKKLGNILSVFKRSVGILANKKAANKNRSKNERKHFVQDNEEWACRNAR
jgi:hypothetical protein